MTAAPSRSACPDPTEPAEPAASHTHPAPADRLLPVPPFPPPRGPRTPAAVAGRAWRRTWPWLAAVAVVVLVVTTELVLLQGHIRADVARLRDAAAAPVARPSATAAPLPAPPVVAPPAAGDVSAVRLRLLDPPCSPAGPCTVVVGVDRRPGAPAAPVSWTVLGADRCRGTLVTLGSGLTPAPTGALGVATVPLPPARALALVAVTAGPARAASAAVPLGAGPC